LLIHDRSFHETKNYKIKHKIQNIHLSSLSNEIQHLIRTKYEQNRNQGKSENYEQKLTRKSNKIYIYISISRCRSSTS
jgi:hypothetical protein